MSMSVRSRADVTVHSDADVCACGRQLFGAIEDPQRQVEAPGCTMRHRGIVEYTQCAGARHRRERDGEQDVEGLARALVVADAREEQRVVGEHRGARAGIAAALGEEPCPTRVLQPGDVVAARAVDLREGELGERGLALRARGARDPNRLRRQALGLVALVVVEQREREKAARLGPRRLVAAGTPVGLPCAALVRARTASSARARARAKSPESNASRACASGERRAP